jgi:hypothetical protein
MTIHDELLQGDNNMIIHWNTKNYNLIPEIVNNPVYDIRQDGTIWTFLSKNGRYFPTNNLRQIVSLTSNKRNYYLTYQDRMIPVQCLVYWKFVRPLQSYEVIKHKNNISTDNRLENLYIVDRSPKIILHPRKPKLKRFCLFCNKELTRRDTKYCNNICHRNKEQKKFIEKWLKGELSGTTQVGNTSHFIKRYLVATFGEKCFKCGWAERNSVTNKVPIELDHIDGNHKNNILNNLRLLCPNCHSLTSTFRNLNKGKGRQFRRKLVK